MALGMVYFGAGVLHGGVVRGRRGTAALPHSMVWIELASLVRDGVVFVGTGTRQGPLGAAPPSPPSPGGGG
eukprot:SAG22_NODE_6009_length_916_cov_1.659731_2_plen_70_part_01